MNRLAKAACGVAGLIALSGAVHAAPVAIELNPADVLMTVRIGTQVFDSITLDWAQWQNGNYGLRNGPILLTAANGSTFTIGAGTEFDPDPLLLIGGGAVNNTAGFLDYTFTFSTPLIPTLSGLVNTSSLLNIALTDGLGDGASMTPVFGESFMLTAFDTYASGEEVSKNVDIGTATTTVFSTFSAASFFTCAQVCVTQTAVLSFTLSPNDSVGFSGRVVQTPVPLPAAAWLLGSGLVGLFGLARGRRLGVEAKA